MKKSESIVINENYDYPRKSDSKLPKDKLYKETSKIVEREIILNKDLSANGQLKQVEGYLDVLKKKIEKIVTDFLFLELFKYTAVYEDEKKFREDLDIITKYIFRFNKDLEIVIRFFDSLESAFSPKKRPVTYQEIEDTYNQVLNLYCYINGLKEEVNKFQKKYFHEFRLSSYALVRNKTIDEIKDLISRVDTEIAQCKNIEEANDFYIYNSGNEIMEMVNEFMRLKKKDNNSLSYRYFLSQDAIIAFKYTEWIDLFVKFNYVLNRIGKSVMYTSEFKRKYRELETRYAIVLIFSEIYK